MAWLHSIEGLIDRALFKAYGVYDDELGTVIEETGTPSGWFRVLDGYNNLPPMSEEPPVPADILEPLQHERQRVLSDAMLIHVKLRLKALYEAGRRGTESRGGAVSENVGDEATEESETVVSGSRIAIPAETFIEELSQELEIHPISVYWLLKEGIEKGGWRCLPEERRIAAERVTVMTLLLLGHQWPTQVAAGESIPDWADNDGIIPLTPGTEEKTLIQRLRERIAADYDGDEPGSFERHFAEVMEKSLEEWVETELFKYQTSLFRKRPIAWQLQSGRYTRRRKPAFACMVYFHKLDRDLLPKIRTQYLGPLKQSWESELRTIEAVTESARTDRQDARRVELEALIEEIDDFDKRLAHVVSEGFRSDRLRELLQDEVPDRWCSIDGAASAPEDATAFVAQEERYLPDVNDGVRVNIAPLQKEGLLATDVLARKDAEKAIADRAEWRSDERRWCREGKLPKPGWWA